MSGAPSNIMITLQAQVSGRLSFAGGGKAMHNSRQDLTRRRSPLAMLIFVRCGVLSKDVRCLSPKKFVQALNDVRLDADKMARMAETLACLQRLQDAYESQPQRQNSWARVCDRVKRDLTDMISLPNLSHISM